ncbi:plastidial pyruvate kinase 4, chloroplastic isoform X2 [Silene latifolia]
MIHSLWQRGTSTTRNIFVCALSNESGQLKTGSSNACPDQKSAALDVADNRPSGDIGFETSMGLEQDDIIGKLRTICFHLLASDQWNASSLKKCDRTYLISGTNLIHYLAMKHLDIEQLKEDLHSISLLNLDAVTPFVLPGLASFIKILESSESNYEKTPPKFKSTELSIWDMRKKASDNRDRLLGQLQEGRTTHIMATIDQEALASQSLIPDILNSGVTVVRINCAHGNQTIWSEIIRKVRQSSQMLEKPCRILMDLAGPKLRTDKQEETPRIIKISPRKTVTGELTLPAQVWLSYKGTDPPAHLSPDALLYIDSQGFFEIIELDDSVYFRDARGKLIRLKISLKLSSYTGVMSECSKTAYVPSGTQLYVKGKGKKDKSVIGIVVDVPPSEQSVRVKSGDLLAISRDGSVSVNQEQLFAPTSRFHRITCSSGYLFDSVKPGETIAFDDGKIWGVIQGTSPSEIIVSVTQAGLKGKKLGSEKSINIPDSSIKFEGLTSKDLLDLEFVASQADMVGVSFIRDVEDIVMVRKQLQKLKGQNLGVVLKIETKDGFENLPQLLLEAMKCPNPLGVMIARGDLAVECGWERLADIQEEILSICSAAHIPVIWATQVLESLVKSGVPTRAEITDVATARRASCIMLNKGKNIREAILMLDAILHKSSQKQKAARQRRDIQTPL